MSHPTAALHDTSPAYASRDYLGRVFALRPTLTQVAESMIQDWLDEGHANAGLRATSTWLGVRNQEDDSYGQLTSLGDALIQRRMNTQVPYSADLHQLLVSSISQDLIPAPAGYRSTISHACSTPWPLDCSMPSVRSLWASGVRR